MHNEILKIGPLTIYGYGLMIGIGILCAVYVAVKRAKKMGLNDKIIYDLVILVLIFGFIGAKLLYCIVEIKSLIQDPIQIISGGGFVLFGGLIGGLLSAMIYCRMKKINLLEYFDLLMPSVAIAQGFGRIGCFLAGCCYGKETDSFCGVTFPHSSLAPGGVKLIPTQLISSAGDFLIALFLIYYANKTKKPGKVGALYLILYSVGRFIIEIFRDDDRGFIGLLSTSQLISIITLVIGLGLFFINKSSDTSNDNSNN